MKTCAIRENVALRAFWETGIFCLVAPRKKFLLFMRARNFLSCGPRSLEYCDLEDQDQIMNLIFKI